jgi:uncharacterized RDD family membrane protein YckC
MMDTLRNSLRALGVAFMNSEIVYSVLMGMGWFFLVGWAVALVVACASVFRQDRTVQFAGLSGKVRHAKLMMKPGGGHG